MVTHTAVVRRHAMLQAAPHTPLQARPPRRQEVYVSEGVQRVVCARAGSSYVVTSQRRQARVVQGCAISGGRLVVSDHVKRRGGV